MSEDLPCISFLSQGVMTDTQAVQFIFLTTKILVSVLATGDFISLMIQSFAFLVFFSYVPWALVCDFRTAREVNAERERIRRIRRGEDLDHVGESTLETKGKKNRWRSDRAWQECLFLTLQGLCWLVSAIFAGIQGGPTACQQVVLQNAVISGLDRLVPDRAATQFCDGMTANIALSCLGVVFTLLWLWWVYYSVKTLRKFEKSTQNGEEVMIVREKVWQKSMARLLRRDEDDDVNGIKRIVTGGLIDLIEMESRRGSIRGQGYSSYRARNARSVPGNGFAVGATTPRPSHESERSSAVSSPVDVMTSGQRMRNTTPEPNPDHTPPPLERRNTNDIIQSLPRGSRSEMPPPPYMGQPANEGTANTYSSSGSGTNAGTGTGTGTGTLSSQESPLSHQAILNRSGTVSSQNTSSRPLPLAPPEVERVVERKIDELAAGGTYNGGTMDAFTAMQLGMVTPSASGSREPSKGQGEMPGRLHEIVDQKMGSFARQNGAGGSSTSGQDGRETMEQLVDRKIGWAGENDRQSTSGPGPSGSSPSYNEANLREFRPSGDLAPTSDFTASPIETTRSQQILPTHPHHINGASEHPPQFQHRANTTSNAKTSPPYSNFNRNVISNKGKSAEAGFSIQNPSPTTSSGTGTGSIEMTLEEMIELKMASLRASSQARPQVTATHSGERGARKGKRKGKGRARAGSDPGPMLERHDETDEE